MKKLKTLYLGLAPPAPSDGQAIDHYPILKIIPRKADEQQIKDAFNMLNKATHLIFTSKTAVKIFFSHLKTYDFSVEQIRKKFIIAVGKSTSKTISEEKVQTDLVAKEETAEGIIKELIPLLFKNPEGHFFWPHSSLSRTVLTDFFHKEQIPITECILYDIEANIRFPLPNLDDYREIQFTSPSTIDAFLVAYGALPKNITLSCIGPVTAARLQQEANNGAAI